MHWCTLNRSCSELYIVKLVLIIWMCSSRVKLKNCATNVTQYAVVWGLKFLDRLTLGCPISCLPRSAQWFHYFRAVLGTWQRCCSLVKRNVSNLLTCLSDCTLTQLPVYVKWTRVPRVGREFKSRPVRHYRYHSSLLAGTVLVCDSGVCFVDLIFSNLEFPAILWTAVTAWHCSVWH